MYYIVGGDRGGRPGEKGAGGVREAGEDGAGSGKKREKLRNIAQYFAIEANAKRREPTNTGREPGLKGTGSGRFQPRCPPPPPTILPSLPTKKATGRWKIHIKL